MRRAIKKSSLLKILFILLTLILVKTVNAESQLERITVATVPTSDLRGFERRYTHWLGYEVRERGRVSTALAKSWGAPKSAGRRYVLMSSAGSPDVFLRAVQAPRVKGYEAMTTWGWNAIEIIVDDPLALHEKFNRSPFKVIGEPKGLNSYPSIVAFQIVGPDKEVIYLTAETGDRDKSPLPLPNSHVDRIFIMVVAGPDIEALLDWYATKFQMPRGPSRQVPIGVVQAAQNLTAEDLVSIGLIRLKEHGNLIELNGYSSAHAGPRPFHSGHLPPGVGITSFSVPDLDALELLYIRPPAYYDGKVYDGRRAATVRGPVGELIELIENKR